MYAITDEMVRMAVASITLIEINFWGDLVFKRNQPDFAPTKFKYTYGELFFWRDDCLDYYPLTDSQKKLFWKLVVQHILQ